VTRSPLTLLAIALSATSIGAAEPAPAKVEFFEKKIRPLLAANCAGCHSAETNSKGGLRVDDFKGLLTGGNSGAAMVPGKPAESLLFKRITQKDEKRRMPLEGKSLSDEQIADVKTWIADGAAWPPIRVPAALTQPKPKFDELKKSHWAWQPLANPKPPVEQAGAWAKTDIDRFIEAKLDAAKLKPVGDADKLTLIRRVTFDLTGLPPTPAAIDDFANDTSAGAFAKVVDRLLASTAFGERWGRHWLDLARYGESTGPSRNIPYPYAWKYRDYVIDSVNADVPYDRFLREQLAGDLLPARDDAERDRLKIATGFLALGVKDVNQRFKVRFIMDNADEQIDAVTRSVLGLTVSCARCHDHKFDPVSQTEYYALAGIFTSTDNASGVRNKMGGGGLDYYDTAMLNKLSSQLPPPPAAQVEKVRVEFEAAKKAWDDIRGTSEGLKVAKDGQPTQRPFRLKFEKLQADLAALTDPIQRGAATHGVRDAKVIADTEVRIRGEAEKLGPVAPRGFLSAVAVPGAAAVNPKQSGRLELAEWLASPKNPLTARVIVNRTWAHLFGRGIVSTVDNFGVMGDKPSHPELLDNLANAFLRDGSSIKKLIRTLVLTRAYQLSAEATEANRQADPANALVWRHSPRRLSAEEYRDAILVASGALDPKRPAGSPAQELKMTEMTDNGKEANGVREAAAKSRARSVYLPLVRGVTPLSLEAFDPVDQTLVSGTRDTTTVAGQALFVLNSSFVRRQSLNLAEAVMKEPKASVNDRIQQVYRRSLGRMPTDTETNRAATFLSDYESAAREELANQPDPKPVKPVPPKPKKPTDPPDNPDDIDQTGEALTSEVVQPKDAKSAAWMAFAQALYGSAEFRFVK